MHGKIATNSNHRLSNIDSTVAEQMLASDTITALSRGHRAFMAQRYWRHEVSYAHQCWSKMNDIITSEEIAGVFNIFHDGVIVKHEYAACCLKLDIDIEYLAARVQKQFTGFKVEISDCENICFKPWNEDGEAGKYIRDINQIFERSLDILSSEIENDRILIHCSMDSTNLDYSGGVLMFTAGSLKVSDQPGKYYTYEELDSLCEEYWTEWENNHKKSGAP